MAGGNNKNKNKQAKAVKKVTHTAFIQLNPIFYLRFHRGRSPFDPFCVTFNLHTCFISYVQNTQEKTQKKTKSGSRSCCPWFLGSVLLLGAIGGLLAYDTQRNGGVFEKSATGKFLKDTGALPYVETAWTKSLSTSARGFQWAEANVPVYVNKTCVVLKPYGEFLKDLTIVGWTTTKEYVVAKTPVVVKFVSENSIDRSQCIKVCAGNSPTFFFPSLHHHTRRSRAMHLDCPIKLQTCQFQRGRPLLVQAPLFTQIALNFWKQKSLCKWIFFFFLHYFLFHLYWIQITLTEICFFFVTQWTTFTGKFEQSIKSNPNSGRRLLQLVS